MDDRLGRRLSSFFGFQQVTNLGHFLGVPFLHNKVPKSTLRFVVDRVHSKLSSWDARQLSFAGRITLAQPVLLLIPSYFMQTMMVPIGICDEIERMVRRFVWGSYNGRSKMALVSWESVCQPKHHGGLGLRKLEDHNTSFMMKMGFNIVLNASTIGIQVLQTKYKVSNGLPNKVWPLLRENLVWLVGDGNSIKCWQDSWIPNCEEIIDNIVSVPPPYPSSGLDRIMWGATSTGTFSLKSAYWRVHEGTLNTKEGF
ncbi:Retrovirus-related Pol polyprotein LINE-1 [Gossypium australe]|uniref:Retrovirus-related Pol polyprotein LINE-1 n=1 Tax=Gossypium australe TaxID=47621 RepID=A0A5B6WZB7_9ROSI|nr:Retrovirus-related Pol polyprotein LINE-1 [Gossypium australe]